MIAALARQTSPKATQRERIAREYSQPAKPAPRSTRRSGSGATVADTTRLPGPPGVAFRELTLDAAATDQGGAAVNISYTEPLSRAWNRMKRILFRPFHIESWSVLGASAFLAGLFTHSGSLFNWNGGNWKTRERAVDFHAEQAMDRAREAMMKVLDNPMILAVIMAILVMFLVFVVVLAWVSARAEFVFLDSVATRRPRFGEPWRRLGGLGRSLFLWRAAFSFVYLPPLLVFGLPFAHTLWSFFTGGDFSMPDIAGVVLGGAVAAMMLVVIAWFSLLMDSFVVPLMYRYDESSRAAWRRFWPLLSGQLGHFLAYGAFYVVLSVATAIGLVIAGFGTCCIGLVLMIIPYVGTVVLLPVIVTARSLGPEYLAQFGPEWATFPPSDPEEEPLIASTPPEPPAEPRPVV
jgi:hypothetical protein